MNEAMRLFPPAWTLERQASADDQVGGFLIPGESTVLLAPYLTHRHPDFWEDPETFDPPRWLDGRTRGLPRTAYLPFGAGARQCIGGAFALLEASCSSSPCCDASSWTSWPGSGCGRARASH